MELANEAPHAYIPFHLAVKSSQPRDYVIVDANQSTPRLCDSGRKFSVFSLNAQMFMENIR